MGMTSHLRDDSPFRVSSHGCLVSYFDLKKALGLRLAWAVGWWHA
jgi:hypothetical protein